MARRILIGATLVFLALFLLMPLAALVQGALARGLPAFVASFGKGELWAAVRLSLLVTAIAVPLNVLFGVAAAWAITKHDFPGKAALIAAIDLPFSVSPVVAGLIWVLMFGRHGLLGPWLVEHDVRVIFALPGIVLATIFVTFPMAARELIPVMEAQGRDEELAARVLGATGAQTFLLVTVPNIRWGLMYGAIVTAARAMGEFGAVSVVSGHIRGRTMTLPLHIEALYDGYDAAGAFSAACLLAMFGLLTLFLKTWAEPGRHAAPRAAGQDGAARR